MSAPNTDIERMGSYDGFRAVSRESLQHLMTWESRGKAPTTPNPHSKPETLPKKKKPAYLSRPLLNQNPPPNPKTLALRDLPKAYLLNNGFRSAPAPVFLSFVACDSR